MTGLSRHFAVNFYQTNDVFFCILQDQIITSVYHIILTQDILHDWIITSFSRKFLSNQRRLFFLILQDQIILSFWRKFLSNQWCFLFFTLQEQIITSFWHKFLTNQRHIFFLILQDQNITCFSRLLMMQSATTLLQLCMTRLSRHFAVSF